MERKCNTIMRERPKLIQALSDLAEIVSREARGRRAVEAMDLCDAIDGLQPNDELPRKIADILARLADLQRSIAKDHRSVVTGAEL
jgi:hypothetical protein